MQEKTGHTTFVALELYQMCPAFKRKFAPRTKLIRIVEVLGDEEWRLDERKDVLRKNALPWCAKRGIMGNAVLVPVRSAKTQSRDSESCGSAAPGYAWNVAAACTHVIELEFQA